MADSEQNTDLFQEINAIEIEPTWRKKFRRSFTLCFVLFALWSMLSFKFLPFGIIYALLNPISLLVYLGYVLQLNFLNGIVWNSGHKILDTKQLLGFIIFVSCIAIYLVVLARASEVSYISGNIKLSNEAIQKIIGSICGGVFGIYILFRIIPSKFAFLISQAILFITGYKVFVYCLKNLSRHGNDYSMISPVSANPLLMSLFVLIPVITFPAITANLRIIISKWREKKTG